MQQTERFFCVGCGEMLEKGEAGMLFRTGFFRVVYRLGCCQSCAESAQSTEPCQPAAEETKGLERSLRLPLGERWMPEEKCPAAEGYGFGVRSTAV